MAIRVARGYEAVHHPYQELYEGSRPSLQGLRPYKGLPVAFVDKLHDDDPVVILPGTWVGLLNTGSGFVSNGEYPNEAAAETNRALVPAMQNPYTLRYTQFDVDFGTPDIDSATNANVSAATANTTGQISATKPIGVVTAPVYSAALPDKFTNYSRDLTPAILCGNYSVVIPVITDNEHGIEPGDLVMIDNSVGHTYDPANVGGNATGNAGRLMAYVDTTGADGSDNSEWVVGRCIHKWVVANGTATTKLDADLTAGTTLTALNTDHDYHTLARVQTVPGLGVSGSGTQGVPAMFKHGYSDGSGNYFALEIRVDL